MRVSLTKTALASLAILLAAELPAAATPRVAGSGFGGASPFATDAYPGFDGLDDIPKPERRETSWFLSVKRDTPAEQLAYCQELEAAEDFKTAAKQYDALVREWPASREAPRAQLRYAQLLAQKLDDYEEAFQQYEYLLNFYSRDCAYLEIVEYEYKLVNLMIDNVKSLFGFSFLSNRQVRQHYESIVRRAPGASYVPEAILKIAALREKDDQYEDAVKVYAMLGAKYPLTPERRLAVYREAKARMWLCRRLAYNKARCLDTVNYLRLAIEANPDLPELEELKVWLEELLKYSEEEVWRDTKFYDSKQRTPHAAIEAYERFLSDYPKSVHADEARKRMKELHDMHVVTKDAPVTESSKAEDVKPEGAVPPEKKEETKVTE